MPEAVYATKDDISGLVGNLANQRTDLQYTNAIEGASDTVNEIIGREDGTNVDTTHPRLKSIKKIVRLLSAAELIGTTSTMLDVRQSYLNEARTLMDNLLKYEGPGETTDFVSSSAPATWPANPAGVIYSTTHPNLKKRPRGDYNMYSLNNPDTFNLA